MKRALPVLLLVGCAGQEGPGDRPRPLVQTGVPSGTPTASSPTVLGSAWRATDPIDCADPDARAERAFDRHLHPDWLAQPFHDESDFAIEEGSGLAVADFTGDGRLDLFVADWVQPRFFAGAPGRSLVDQTATWLPGDLERTTGAAAVDLDDDGDLDLFLARTDRNSKVLLNTGAAFAAAPALPFATNQLRGTGSSWGDIDGDGDLDGYLNTYGAPHGDWDPNLVMRNDGGGVLSDASAGLPEALLSGHTLAGGWYDLDGDHDLDVYLVNDFGTVAMPNQVGFNDGAGNFSVPTEDLGLGVAMAGMGASAEDLNGDGRLDLLLSGWKRVQFLMSAVDTLWVDYTTASGFPHLWEDDPDRRLVWGNSLADLDNDGDHDAAIAFGYLRNTFGQVGNPFEQRDAVLRHDPDGSFVEVTDAWGLESLGVSRGLLTVDLDDDGWLDLVIQDLAGPPAVFYARCGAEAWLRVRLEQPGVNRFAVGAVVTVVAGDRSWTRDVRAGGAAIGSGGPPEVHVGLGEVEVIDRVEVRWPDGTVEMFEGLSPRTIATITRDPRVEEAL